MCYCTYVWIYEKGAKGWISHTKRAAGFFPCQKLSKGDDLKIKRKVSPFFLLLHVYLSFIAVLSPFLARLHGLEAA